MKDIRQYRKKPVVIEAMQFRHKIDEKANKQIDVIRWIRENGGEAYGTGYEVNIETLEGTMTAQIDDYIIKGVNGEFYPCKPDIFEATYEAVS